MSQARAVDELDAGIYPFSLVQSASGERRGSDKDASVALLAQ